MRKIKTTAWPARALMLASALAISLAWPAQAFAAPEGWQHNADGTWAFYSQRSVVTGWRRIENAWYYFKENGVMTTGWFKVGGKWYHFNEDGSMATGWVFKDGQWYFLTSSGAMATGWIKSGGSDSGPSQWYFMRPNGAMATGWVRSGGEWYFMNPSGEMTTGWLDINGKKYYMYMDGRMAIGVVEINGELYEFNENGELVEAEPTPEPTATPQPSTEPTPEPTETTPPYEMTEDERIGLNLINEERAKEGVPPLEYHPVLGKMAMYKAQDLSVHYGHDSPTYGGVRELFEMFNMPYFHYGENIAFGFDTVESVTEAWLNSPGHRRNIMADSFTHVGIGHYITPTGGHYWAQEFCKPTE